MSRTYTALSKKLSGDGRAQIDVRLLSRPDSAREVLSAEIAHAVDYGLPLLEPQKAGIKRLFLGGGG